MGEGTRLIYSVPTGCPDLAIPRAIEKRSDSGSLGENHCEEPRKRTPCMLMEITASRGTGLIVGCRGQRITGFGKTCNWTF